MKLRNSQIISFLNTYTAIKTKKLPVKLGYAIKKNVSAVTAASEAYSAERNELLKHYAQKGENGQFLVNDGCYVIPDQEGYAKDIEELLNIETEAEIQTVSLDVLEKCDDPRFDPLTIEELTALEFMTE